MVTSSAAWFSAMFHYEKRLNLYIITSFLSKHILIGLIFEPVWIIYEIAGNSISDYRIQVEFHFSQPMNFLSNTDPLPLQIFF